MTETSSATQGPYRRILVAVDFSETSARALEVACDLAARCGAELVLVHAYFVPLELEGVLVAGPKKVSEMLHQEAHERLSALAEEISKGGAKVAWLAVDGVPEQAIVRFATEREADLIVMGTHGRTGVSHALLGSRTERVLRTSPCPVLAVPPAAGRVPDH